MKTIETAEQTPPAPSSDGGTTIVIDGMSCAGCVAHVTRALAAVAGISIRSVSIGAAEIGPSSASNLSTALAALAGAGYLARVATVHKAASGTGSLKAGGCCGGRSGAGGSCCG